MAISNKIKYHRERLHMTQAELAKRLHTTPQNVYKYENGIITNIPLSRIEAMATIFGVAPEQLIGWEDAPAPAEVIPFPTREIDGIYDALNDAGQTELCNYGRYLTTVDMYKAKEKPRPGAPAKVVPLLGAAFAAGSPEAPGDLFACDYRTTDLRAEFAIHINGDSMEPWLPDGSVALGVKRMPRDGEVGAFFLDGGFLVKQYAGDSQGNVYLFSLNRHREDADETIWHDSGRDLRTIGPILLDAHIPLP